MTIDATVSRSTYTGTAKALHWLIVALLIVQFILAWTMPEIRRDTPVTTLIDLHFSFGVSILAVAVIRLLLRVVRGVPVPEAGIPGWQETSSQIVHWLLYALLLIVPLLGWINADFRGMPVGLFGFEMPHAAELRPGLAIRASAAPGTARANAAATTAATIAVLIMHLTPMSLFVRILKT